MSTRLLRYCFAWMFLWTWWMIASGCTEKPTETLEVLQTGDQNHAIALVFHWQHPTQQILSIRTQAFTGTDEIPLFQTNFELQLNIKHVNKAGIAAVTLRILKADQHVLGGTFDYDEFLKEKSEWSGEPTTESPLTKMVGEEITGMLSPDARFYDIQYSDRIQATFTEARISLPETFAYFFHPFPPSTLTINESVTQQSYGVGAQWKLISNAHATSVSPATIYTLAGIENDDKGTIHIHSESNWEYSEGTLHGKGRMLGKSTYALNAGLVGDAMYEATIDGEPIQEESSSDSNSITAENRQSLKILTSLTQR